MVRLLHRQGIGVPCVVPFTPTKNRNFCCFSKLRLLRMRSMYNYTRGRMGVSLTMNMTEPRVWFRIFQTRAVDTRWRPRWRVMLSWVFSRRNPQTPSPPPRPTKPAATSFPVKWVVGRSGWTPFISPPPSNWSVKRVGNLVSSYYRCMPLYPITPRPTTEASLCSCAPIGTVIERNPLPCRSGFYVVRYLVGTLTTLARRGRSLLVTIVRLTKRVLIRWLIRPRCVAYVDAPPLIGVVSVARFIIVHGITSCSIGK